MNVPLCPVSGMMMGVDGNGLIWLWGCRILGCHATGWHAFHSSFTGLWEFHLTVDISMGSLHGPLNRVSVLTLFHWCGREGI